MRFAIVTVGVALLSASCATTPSSVGTIHDAFNIRGFGAVGDGVTLDTRAVNAAIDAADRAGGGTVYFPAGRFACHSLHLKSNVTLELGSGAVLLAAPAAPEGSDAETYDPPEANPSDPYQDFGHSHFHNSLIWGEGLHDICIRGPGMIDGEAGLTRGYAEELDPTSPGTGVGSKPVRYYKGPSLANTQRYPQERDTLRDGVGNKSIALKNCRNVILRDVTIRAGGHFGVLATGVENMTVSGLQIDTNRDGIDIVSCRNVHVSDCSVNSPSDDGICLKADLALGHPQPCEAITITNCVVSGWRCGSVLDGTHHGGGGCGRIKLGTESSGAFLNITISNCVFDNCSGLALESVDGARLEDIAIDNITMRHPSNAPIFLRLGARLRGPDGTRVGTLQRVSISNLVAYDAAPHTASIISGIPGHAVRDVKISHVQIYARGGKEADSAKWATRTVPEVEEKYPDPPMFGATPAYGFYVRHAAGITFNDVSVQQLKPDQRSAFVLDDVTGVKFLDVDADQREGVPTIAQRTPTTRLSVRGGSVSAPAATQP